MSFLSGLTIGLFRETRDGRRVIGLGPVGSPKADGDWWAWLSTVMFGTLTVMMGRQIVVRRVRR